MDIWIKTQNEDELIKPNKLYFKNYVEKVECYAREVDYHSTDYYDVMSDMGWLGRYNSKQRALEVLQEIQEAMTPKRVFKFEGKLREEDIQKIRELIKNEEVCVIDNRINVVTKESYVYKMPKE